MGSNTLAAFLSKLLKPDRKDNIPSTNKSKVLKRHSAPVPNGFDVRNPAHIPPPAPVKNSQSKSNRRQRNGVLELKQGEEIQNSKKDDDKKNRQDKKPKKNAAKENEQNVPMRKAADGSDRENGRGNKAGSRSRKTTRRHSTGLAYWFCVSGNADTLERGMKAPFPRERKNDSGTKDSDKNAKKRQLGIIPEQRQSNDKGINIVDPLKPVSLAGVIRRDGKKKKGDAKNRHSAPPDTLAVYRPKERPLTPNQYQDFMTHSEERPGRRGLVRSDVAPSPTRSMSPGVRYRVDGTLERPYVFPSALTFGAEGRKLQLRSSDVSPVQEIENFPRSNLSTSTSMVLAEVHNAVCETEKTEKRLGSESNIADISYDDFDVRKAFYLKYDGCDTKKPQAAPPSDTKLYRHSMPMFPANFDVMNAHHNGGFRNPDGPQVNGADDIHQSQSATVRQRYSTPPKNDEFVYMGSTENLNMWSEFVDRQGIQNNNTITQNEAENTTRKRYSSPVHNRDYVYMGSIENIHLLNVEDKRAGCMSLKRDVDGLFPPADITDPALTNGDPGIANSSLSGDENQDGEVASTHTPAHGNGGLKTTGLSMHKQRFEEHHHSLPELCLHNDRYISRNVYSESGAIDDDIDTDKENPIGAVNRNPFSRNLGRASCMPGNKKSFAPPPAIFSQSDGTIQLTAAKTASDNNTATFGKFSGLPGNKKFKLPPPPNYTPPREEMEAAHTKLLECHKGSQTDLHEPTLYCVNMEDRDLSLNQDQAKTIQSSSFLAEPPKALTEDSNENGRNFTAEERPSVPNMAIKDHPKHHTQIQRLLNASTSSQGSDDVFKDGSASDTIGQAEGFQPSRRGKYSLPGVRAKLVSESYSDNPSMNVALNDKPANSRLPSEYDNTRVSEKAGGYPPINVAPNDKPTKCRLPSEYDNIPSVGETAKYQTVGTNSTEAKSSTEASQNEDKKETWKNFKAMDIVDAFVTSTPKIARREKSEERLDSIRTKSRPVPTPRKRYSAIELGSKILGSPRSTTFPAVDLLNIMGQSSTQQSLDHHKGGEVKEDQVSPDCPPSLTKSPPVPKKRRNISKSRTDSDSCFSSLEIREEVEPRQTAVTKTEPEGPRKPEITQNLPDRSTRTTSVTAGCAANSTDKSTTEGEREAYQPKTQEPVHQQRSASNKRYRKGRSLDDTCIADDELSCFEDGEDDVARDSTLKRRRRSMRKCVSVDDLLRSGSILDRSLILARKRRRRMRDRKCRSQIQLSSSDAEDTAEMLSVRRKAASRERLSGKKDKMAAAASLKSAMSDSKQVSGYTMDSSVKENVRFTSTAREAQRNCPTFAQKYPHSTVSFEDAHRSENLSKKTNTSCKYEARARQAPWEVGLFNFGRTDPLGTSPSSSHFVPRWRSGISASTPSLAEKPKRTGKETVV